MASARLSRLLALEIPRPWWPPGIDREIRDLIRRMSRENPLWGAPRIHSELLMLGIEGWKTFLRNHAAGIASIDLFVVRAISFKLLYGLVVLRHAHRRLVTISVTSNLTPEWIAGQLTDAFSVERSAVSPDS